jgi:peptidoglycan/xylan/chitin deacetylase (PgdA/CDA1 family)
MKPSQIPEICLLIILILIWAPLSCSDSGTLAPTVLPGETVTPFSQQPAPMAIATASPSPSPIPRIPTATLFPTATATSSPSPTPDPTPPPTVATTPEMPPNELGQVMVLEYHHIGRKGGKWGRTPEEFRQDMEWLLAEGYYPINLRDFAAGWIEVPRGKSPVVLTFDDSYREQFNYLNGEGIDPYSAVGILLEIHQRHPQVWPLRATFFVLLNEEGKAPIPFGQPEYADRKLAQLVEWGMEIGSHTLTHPNFKETSLEEIRRQLAVSENLIEQKVPGYEVSSLSPPYGAYPEDLAILKAGEYEGLNYDFDAAVKVGGSPSPSPFSKQFDPYRIDRIQGFQEELDHWFGYFQSHPELRFVSDGNPMVVTVPEELPASLQGTLNPAALQSE